MLETNDTLGHFQILKQLGAGGMGVVYLAEDRQLGRRVALKVLTAERDPVAVRRFLREAQAASALDHPNIATVFEVAATHSPPFIAMAYCPGETLRDRILRGPLSLNESCAILEQIALALDCAHASGVVHRDLKPANVMVGPDGHVRILDFGIATMSADSAETATRLTAVGLTVGTLAYMPPEMLRGQSVDGRADVWALGVTVYEMLTGRVPFDGTQLSIIEAVLHEQPVSLVSLRPDAPPELVAIVDRALTKDPAQRTSTPREIADEAGRLRARLTGATVATRERPHRRWSRVVTSALAVTFIATALSAGVWYRQMSRTRWARETVLPQIQQLAEHEDYSRAFALAEDAQRILGDDRELAALWPRFSRTLNIDSIPAGATVRYRQFGVGEPLHLLGETPIRGSRIPLGFLEWEISKPGLTTVRDVGLLPPYLTIRDRAPAVPYRYVLEPPSQAPPGMVRAHPWGPHLLAIAGLEHVPAFELGAFWVDQYEVTNREYKAFVDAGGYREPRFWKHPFVKDGQSISWGDAIKLFVDRTGRPGPATWELGTYREGRDSEPVGGVSWYEAAAFAEYAGKSLPTIFQWSVVADRRATSAALLSRGRYLSDGPLPVGQSGAMSRFGTFDLAGNVKEWCLNEAGGGRRYTLGGGWSDPAYFFNDADARSPFDREPAFGFRSVKPVPGEPVSAALSQPVEFFFRDFSLEKPVSDQVFRAYASLYSYDRGDLAPRTELTDDTPRDWRVETVSFNAAYGGERMAAHLLLPKRAAPPYQTLIFFPGINALHETSSLQDGLPRTLDLADFLVRSGRALVVPVYKSTHERHDDLTSDFPATTSFYRDHVVMWSKDLQRTVDYLETRPDVDRSRLAYLGRSWGAAMGTIMVATEPRLKLAIFHVGGFYFQHARPEAEAINFAPRVHVPSLMLNGRFDFFFPEQTSQRFMFDLIGVPSSEKRWKVYDTSHALPRAEMSQETLAWLDRYFGPVPIK
jgi:dienelactone hydrolase/tRNA A-37 threonylcarbamoyl transferase component Bud32